MADLPSATCATLPNLPVLDLVKQGFNFSDYPSPPTHCHADPLGVEQDEPCDGRLTARKTKPEVA